MLSRNALLSVEMQANLVSWSRLPNSTVALSYQVRLSVSVAGLFPLPSCAPLRVPITTQSSQVHQPQQPLATATPTSGWSGAWTLDPLMSM